MRVEEFDTECDGAFMLYDTARHHGWPLELADAQAHVMWCGQCHESGNGAVLEISEWDDSPILG